MRPRFDILAIFSSLMVAWFAVPATPAIATPARSRSLLAHRGLPDDTDLFIFPASLFRFENAAYLDFSFSSSDGSGGALFHRQSGAALFLNRDDVGRFALGSSDDIVRTRLTLIPVTGTQTATLTSQLPQTPQTAALPPIPDKVFDLILAKPLQSPGRWLGLGVSFSHKSEDRGTAARTVADETGAPVTLTSSQSARSTLVALVPSYRRDTEANELECSLYTMLSLFRIENDVLGDVPTGVPEDALSKAQGALLGQAGPPSFGGAFRWQSRGSGSAPDWIFFGTLDRRDYDSASPPDETKVEADEYQVSLQIGPRWKPADGVTVSLTGEAAFDQQIVSPNPGPSRRVSTYTLPNVHASAEARPFKYVSVRGGMVSSFQIRRSRLPGSSSGPERLLRTDSLTAYNWAVGLSGHFKSLDLDASVQPSLLTHGPALIGGDGGQGGGPGLFTLLSLTYRFGEPANLDTKSSEPPADATPPAQP